MVIDVLKELEEKGLYKKIISNGILPFSITRSYEAHKRLKEYTDKGTNVTDAVSFVAEDMKVSDSTIWYYLRKLKK